MDKIKLVGNLHIECGNQIIEIPNLVVNVGKNLLTTCLNGGASTTYNRMAIGTSGTTPQVTDTALGAEIARVLTTNTVSGNIYTAQGIFGPGVGTGALQEAGLFDAITSGNMLSHTTFATINKGSSDTLTITWTVLVG